MKKDTQRRIESYQERLPRIKEKIGAAGVGLLIATVMAASATFAWVTLSKAPEVSNMATNLSANGSLEIALSKPNGSLPDEVDIDEGAGITGGSSITSTNLQWGNLVNLSDPSYGFENLVLRPAELNSVALLTNPLKGAVYASDGRITTLDTNYAYTKWDTELGKFKTTGSNDGFGVRAISSYKEEITGSDTDARLQEKLQTLLNAINNVESVYSDSKNGVAANFKALGGMISTYAQDKVNATLSSPTDTSLSGYLSDMLKCYQAVERAMVTQKDAYVAQANLQQYLYTKANPGTKFTELKWEQLEANHAQYNAASATEQSKNKTISLVGLSTFITDLNKLQKDVGYIQEYRDDYINNQTEYKWNSGAPSGKPQLSTMVSDLVHYSTMTIDLDNNGKETVVVKLGKDNISSLMSANGKVRNVYVYDGILKNFEQLAVSPAHRLNGNAACTVKITAIMSITVYGHAYTKAEGNATFQVGANNTMNQARNSTTANMVGVDTYGMVLDLWFRTNAEQTCLTLEGAAVKDTETGTILRYDGVNRIWGKTDQSGVLTTESTTQGGGSCYVYYADNPDDMNRSLRLLRAMRVTFVDQKGEELATAEMDTENYYAVNGRITVPLVLDPTTKTTYTYKNDLNEDVLGRAITTLYTDQPQRISAIVYLNGNDLTNDDVLAANEIQGQLNVQFGSSAALKSIGNNELMDDVRTVTAEVDKTEINYDNRLSDEDLKTRVKVNITGVEPTKVEAFFVRAINSTQGSREETMTFTKADDGWYSTYQFKAPGTYYLRNIRVNDVDYPLTDNIPKVEVKGFALESVTWGESTDEITVYTSDTSYTESVTVKFATNEVNKMPSTVEARFERQDGNYVSVPMTYSSSQGRWTGTANITLSGQYTLRYLAFNGLLVDLVNKNMEKKIDLKLGMYVQVTHDTGTLNDRFETGKTFTKSLHVKIFDNSNTELKALENAKLYYSGNGSALFGADSNLTWNETMEWYDATLPITRAGRYTFRSVEVQGNALTRCDGDAPVYTVVSPEPPEFVQDSQATYYQETQFAPLSYDAFIDHVGIRNGDAATITAVVYNELSGQYYTVNNRDGSMSLENAGWVINLPTYTTELDADGKPISGAKYTQEGKWSLVALSLTDCYDSSSTFRGDENPIIWAGTDAAAQAYLQQNGLTATESYDLSKLSTTVSCTLNVTMEPGTTALGSRSADFMTRHSVKGTGMQVRLTNDAGVVIPASKISDVLLTIQYTPPTTDASYGYKVQSTASLTYQIHLNTQDNDTGGRTVSLVNGAADMDWQYVGEYRVQSLQVNVGGVTQTFQPGEHGVPEKYTVTSKGPTADNIELVDVRQRTKELGRDGTTPTGEFLGTYTPSIAARVQVKTNDARDNTDKVILDDVSMSVQLTHQGGSAQNGGYTFTSSQYTTVNLAMEASGNTYNTITASPLLAGTYAGVLTAKIGSVTKTYNLDNISVYSVTPELKVTGVNPGTGETFSVNTDTSAEGYKWNANNIVQVQNYFTDYLAAVYIKAEENDSFENHDYAGWTIANYSVPQVTLSISKGGKFDTATVTIPNASKSDSPSVFNFTSSAVTQTADVGCTSENQVKVKSGVLGIGDIYVTYQMQHPAGEQVVSQMNVTKGSDTYTVTLQNPVTVREKSVAPPAIQYAAAEESGFTTPEAVTSKDGAAFTVKLPTSIGEKENRDWQETDVDIDAVEWSSKTTEKLVCIGNGQTTGKVEFDGFGWGTKKYTCAMTYTYDTYKITTVTKTSPLVTTTTYQVWMGLIGWNINGQEYKPGAEYTVNGVVTAIPIIGVLEDRGKTPLGNPKTSSMIREEITTVNAGKKNNDKDETKTVEVGLRADAPGVNAFKFDKNYANHVPSGYEYVTTAPTIGVVTREYWTE